FFQAEDGIRDFHVTGVQTCALPILRPVSAVSAAVSFAGVSAAAALVSMRATSAPISRSSPSAATHSSLPEASAGNSRVALSDSRSEERRVGKSVKLNNTP